MNIRAQRGDANGSIPKYPGHHPPFSFGAQMCQSKQHAASPCLSGFLYSFEAATALILLALSVAALPLFELRQSGGQEFFLCSDAAAVLAKTNSLPALPLQERVDEAHALSGMCISAEIAGITSSSCQEAGGEKISISIPVWQGGVENMAVSCWRGR